MLIRKWCDLVGIFVTLNSKSDTFWRHFGLNPYVERHLQTEVFRPDTSLCEKHRLATQQTR